MLRAQRQIAFFGEKAQLFFLQYGSLLSLRFFPLHPWSFVHAFFVVVRKHSEGNVLLGGEG